MKKQNSPIKLVNNDHSNALRCYFTLAENKILTNGAKNSVILDLKERKLFKINSSAKSIIELGQQNYKVEDAIKEIRPKLKRSEVISFIRDLLDLRIITLSRERPPQPKEKKLVPKLDMIWIEITPQCNLRCVHCYAEAEYQKKATKNDLSNEEIKRIIDDAASLGCHEIQFTGGEATLRKDIEELIEYAKEKEFNIEIFTNGTLLTEQLIRFLKENNVRVAMSIYSYNAKTHDAITQVEGSFEKTLNSLKLLLAYRVPLRCSVVVMKQNENEIEQTVYFLSQLGVLSRPPDTIRPSGRGKGMENWPQQFGRKTLKTKPDFIISKENFEKNRDWNSCWVGKAAVTAEGNVIPCVFARKQIVGNIKSQSFAKLITSETMQRLWSLNKDKVEVCRDCEFRYVCEDCRPWATEYADNLHAKPPRCTYNPYTGEWEKAQNLFKKD